ncbi:hypothetical protein ACFCVY_12650 [Streptomyces sp. NPDC056411]|uniref:hypothetical protein n=1 Tax=Streptomyces sp. NPDC056411 TaxID=3345813 RepID=UPI0035E1B435
MENPAAATDATATSAPTTAAAPAAGPDAAPHDRHRTRRRRRRTAGEWAGLAVLAVVVLATGAFVRVVGPLLAIACASCQDGVRGPMRFGDALLDFAEYGVPLVALATVAGIFLPRGGARAGGIGLGVLIVLLVAMVVLGQVAV